MPLLIDHPLGPFWAWPDSIGKALQRGEFWDSHLRPAMDAGDADGWALDLGASTGWFTVYLAKRYRGVLAVEAHPATGELLEQTITLHKLTNVVTVHAAAYDRSGSLRMATGAELGWSLPSQTDLEEATCASGIAFRPDDAAGLRVNAYPMDLVVPVDVRVSFIKVDCQGCDLRALKGLVHTIARCRPVIVFEYEAISEQWHGDRFEDYLSFLGGLGYRVEQIDPSFQDYLATPI
jgi:FkbM family methyltransferase